MLKVGDRVKIRPPQKNKEVGAIARLDGALGTVVGASPDPMQTFIRLDGQELLGDKPYAFPDHWLEQVAVKHEEDGLEQPADVGPCATEGHEFLYALNDVGDPILVFCGECGRQWTTTPKLEESAPDNDEQTWSLREITPPANRRSTIFQQTTVDPTGGQGKYVGTMRRTRYVVAPTRHEAIVEATKLGLGPDDVRTTKESLRGIGHGSEIEVFGLHRLERDIHDLLVYLSNIGVVVRFH